MFEIDKQKFGAFVGELRREKGYTQKELAQHLFISDKAVSKWETGASIPDTALLIPLAELLGVSVTELLMCQRVQQSVTMETEQVEDIVKTAITYAEVQPQRAYQSKTMWHILYAASLLIGCAGLLFSYLNGYLSEAVLTLTILGAAFGVYFCFFVQMKLPRYYDENRIGAFSDGPLRMNIPGVRFNNSNWPHVVRVGRIWSCTCMALFPLIEVVLNESSINTGENVMNYVLLFLTLGGLLIPMYIVGKKYE